MDQILKEGPLPTSGARTAPASRDTAQSKGVHSQTRVGGEGAGVCACVLGAGQGVEGGGGDTHTFSFEYTSVCLVSYKWNCFCNFKIKF